MPQVFRAPQITLPEELLDIHRFMNLFNSLIEGPISCDLVNGLPRYPQAGSVLEFTFEVTPTANHIPGITENNMEATFVLPLLGLSEMQFTSYIKDITPATTHIATRIYFLMSMRTTLSHVLYKLSVAENAIPRRIRVRAGDTEWIIDPFNVEDPLPQLLTLVVPGYEDDSY